MHFSIHKSFKFYHSNGEDDFWLTIFDTEFNFSIEVCGHYLQLSKEEHGFPELTEENLPIIFKKIVIHLAKQVALFRKLNDKNSDEILQPLISDHFFKLISMHGYVRDIFLLLTKDFKRMYGTIDEDDECNDETDEEYWADKV